MEKQESLIPSEQIWTDTISAKVKWYDLKLKELWAYRDLLFLFVKRDFVSAYKQTILGPIWHFIQPIITTMMFFLIFGKIANIPTDGIPGPIFYMAGLALWSFFSTSFMGTSSTFTSNAGIFGKVYFPRLISPLSVIISATFKFIIQLVLLFIFIIYFKFKSNFSIHITTSIFLIVPIIFVAGILGLSFGIIISSLTTKYRDFHSFVSYGVQFLMYATPIVYPLSYVKNDKLLTLIHLNPLTSLLELFRFAVLGTTFPTLYQIAYTLAFTIVSFFVGIILFNYTEKSFMDTV